MLGENLFTLPLSLLQITKGLDRDRNCVSKLRVRRQTAWPWLVRLKMLLCCVNDMKRTNPRSVKSSEMCML